MKTFTANYLLETSKSVSTLAGCLKIVTKDNTTYLYTDHDKDIIVNTGETYDGTYISTHAYAPTAFSFTSDLSVDNFDITGIIDDINIKEIDLLNNIFGSAEVWYFSVNYNTSTSEVTAVDGINKVFFGYIGNIKFDDEKYTTEVRSLSTKLTKATGDIFSKTCRTTLGSSECGIVIDPPVWVSSTDYELGDIVKASAYDGRRYICTIAGTSNATEPTWDITIDNTTADNTVTWITKDSYLKELTVTMIGTYARYYRITISDCVLSTQPKISEIQGISARDENIFTLYGTASDNGSFATHEASKSIDNDTNTYYQYNGNITVTPAWIKIDVGQPRNVKYYRMWYVDDNSAPSDWILEASLNNVDWFTVDTQSSRTDPGGTWTPNFNTIAGPAVPAGTKVDSKRFIPFSQIGDYADNLLNYGVLTWTSGENSGTKQEIKSSSSSVELFLPTFYYPEYGDTFTATVGCNRTMLGSDGTTNTGDCYIKYNNVINFRGEAYIPTDDLIIGGSGPIDRDE